MLLLYCDALAVVSVGKDDATPSLDIAGSYEGIANRITVFVVCQHVRENALS